MASRSDVRWVRAEVSRMVGPEAARAVLEAGLEAQKSAARPAPQVLQFSVKRSRFWLAVGLALGAELDRQFSAGTVSLEAAGMASSGLSEFLIRQNQLALDASLVRGLDEGEARPGRQQDGPPVPFRRGSSASDRLRDVLDPPR